MAPRGEPLSETELSAVPDSPSALMEFALEVTEARVWRWDVATNEVTAFPSGQTVFNTDVATVEDYLDQIHPDHRQDVQKALETTVLDGGTYEVEFQTDTDEGSRWIADVGRPVSGADGRYIIGIAQDITERKQREQLFGHLLRHSLRNDTNVIHGYAEQLYDALEDEGLKTKADTISTTAKALYRLGEKATRLTQLLSAGWGHQQRIDLSARLDTLTARMETNYPNAEVVTSLDVLTDVYVDERLTFALEELLENAVRHNHQPRVDVELQASDPPSVGIVDDGKGIPEIELTTVNNRQATDISHGTGIGIPAARWAIESAGGSLTIDTGPSGTAVVVELPTSAVE